MKLSRASSYAVTALVPLASEEPDRLVPSQAIVQPHSIPARFILKLLTSLVSARSPDSVKGSRGGYRLVRPAAKITLLKIGEAVGRPICVDARSPATVRLPSTRI